jgi:predicted DNA-binding protein with PD1-like motif
MITLHSGNPVAATMEIIGKLNITSLTGDIYMTGVDSTDHVHVYSGNGNVHASAVVAESIDLIVDTGNINIIELFLGNVFALIPGKFYCYFYLFATLSIS